MRSRYLPTAALVICVCLLSGANWPQFRGPGGLGISSDTGLPVKFSPSNGVVWKTALPGPGHSSPVVWGEKIFLTAFQPEQSLTRLFSNKGRLYVLCLDKSTGRQLWKREVAVNAIEETHSTNAPASPTPVTDGSSVYVYFGSKGVIAFDLDGNLKWEFPLGPYPNEWGSASSPILYHDLLILNCDTDGDDFLLALDKNRGRIAWRTSRKDVTRAWPTPFIWNANGMDEIVVSGSERIKSYDPKTGKELWTVDGLTTWVTPTPVAAYGLLYAASDGPGGNVILAIRPGGRGNITGTHVAWKYTRSAPYTASMVVAGEYLYGVRNGGILICLNARTGAEQFIERLPAGGSYFASPVLADGKIYLTSEDGQVSVIAAGPKFQLLATNALHERVMASPVPAEGRLLIRSDSNLYAFGK